MTDEMSAFVVLVCLAVAAALNFQRRWDGCRECGHCARAEQEKAADQAALQHEVYHKGSGFRPGDPDRYACPDERCVRNPKR